MPKNPVIPEMKASSVSAKPSYTSYQNVEIPPPQPAYAKPTMPIVDHEMKVGFCKNYLKITVFLKINVKIYNHDLS